MKVRSHQILLPSEGAQLNATHSQSLNPIIKPHKTEHSKYTQSPSQACITSQASAIRATTKRQADQFEKHIPREVAIVSQHITLPRRDSFGKKIVLSTLFNKYQLPRDITCPIPTLPPGHHSLESTCVQCGLPLRFEESELQTVNTVNIHTVCSQSCAALWQKFM